MLPQHYLKDAADTLVQQAGMPLTYLDPNIEYRLVLTIYNDVITHSSQHMIRIHFHVSNITRVISKLWSGIAYFQYLICTLKGRNNNYSFVRK